MHGVERRLLEWSRATLFSAVRGMGKLLPLSVLWILLWPAAVLDAAIHWCRLRPFMKQKGAVALYRRGRVNVVPFVLHRAQMILVRLLFLWPEQLSRDRWHRCRYEPDGAFDAARLADRPTLLVTLHSGPISILLEWFRTQGLPVAIVSYVRLSELAAYRQRLIRLRDELAGLDGIPLLIQPGRTRDMHDHLVTHKLLIVAIDVGDGPRVRMPRVDGIGLAMNTGALQLARMTDARVVPCLIRSGPFFRFTIRFGPEFNDVDVSTPDGVAKAAEDLWRIFVPMICMAPDECEITLLRALRDERTV